LLKPCESLKLLRVPTILTQEVLKNSQYFYFNLESFPVLKTVKQSDTQTDVYFSLTNDETFKNAILIKNVPSSFIIALIRSIMTDEKYLRRFIDTYKTDLEKLDIADEYKIYVINLLDTFEESYQKYGTIALTTDDNHYTLFGTFVTMYAKEKKEKGSIRYMSINWVLKKMYPTIDKSMRHYTLDRIKNQINIDLKLNDTAFIH
jgi:hypothetical protein